ncbi:DUF4192 domain-containing protein [Nocardioides lijunqiniae]|uniref:DUF4192 domain-containing protein n=1 Tax=Nocardioides lijunqiniae TaxID=2760832 RepID=UPI0018788FC6|nr:DUF4192 domain-containing protein [Nocardioides lijunqiniae]
MTHHAPLSMTATCPEDLLAMVPVTLGFAPEESVVMLTFGGRAFQARVDLPLCLDEVPDVVASLVGPARRHRVERVVFVLYTDDEVLAGRLARGLRDRCRGEGIAVLETLRAHDGRWFPLLHGDRVVREVGVPYDVSAHPFLVDAVLRGRVTLRSRTELEATLRSDPARVAAVAAALAEGRPAGEWDRDHPPPTPVLLVEGRWVQDTVRRHVVDGSRPTDGEAARLLRAVVLLRLRDAAWQMIRRAEARAHVELWADLVRRCPQELLAGPAALLGWAAWQAGDGALAWCALDRVHEVEPRYGLASHLALLLEHAVPPEEWEADVDWAEGLRASDGSA